MELNVNVFCKIDCLLSNLTSFISCRTSLTAIKDDIEIVEKLEVKN